MSRMSLLSPDIHAALTQLLEGLYSKENATRTQAEEQLNNEWIAKRPEVLMVGLAEQMQGSDDPVKRSFAAVLFRRIASRSRKIPPTPQQPNESTKELFLTLSQDERVAIRQKLILSLQSEALPNVRNKIGDSIAEIARQYTDDGEQWPELLNTLFQASQSPDSGLRENAFRIFAATPDIIERQHEETVLGAFTKGFKDDSVSVRIQAMKAFSSFFRSINKKSQRRYFPLIPEVLNILPPLKEAGDTDQLEEALLALIELAEVAPTMFKPLFQNLVLFSVSVVQDKELGNLARQNALELMTTFADYAPQMCRKDPKYTSEMVTQCLSLMTDIGVDDDDAKDWLEAQDEEEEESDSNHVAGEQTMDRLANRLGGATLLLPTFNWLPRMVQSSQWRDRHAALMAISAISEGCRDLMVGELNKVLELVVPSLQDPHPRVRWAGCNALGQMSTDFAGTMQNKYHQIVMTSIIPVLDSPEPRVQAHAAAALVNFCEEAEPAILEPYLDELLNHLFKLLQSNVKYVQEQALSTIATIADSAEKTFAKYYDTLMPLLFGFLRNEVEKPYRLLRAKAMECATLIALAVGKERMGQDAVELVQILGSIQAGITDDDDPQANYLLHCWGRMCRILEQDFLRYLPAVMAPLVQLASASADIELLDDEEQIEQLAREEGWEMVPLKGKTIGIKTSTLDDKNMAIELLEIYADTLKEHFEAYVPEIMEKIILPGLAFFFHDPVRVSSAKCVPTFLNSYKRAHGLESPQFKMLWEKTVIKLLEILSAEPAIDTLATMFECFYESLEIVGKNSLTQDHMSAFIQSAKSTLEDFQTRLKARAEERQSLEDGEEESDEMQFAIEDDQTLLSDMNKAFHTIFKHHGLQFLPPWTRLMPFYDAFVISSDPTNRQWALCIFDDVLEFCGEHSWSYSEHLIQPLLDGLADSNPANRQAAAYGVGVAAQKGGVSWSDFVAASIPALFQVCATPQAREEDHVYATENACASIAKILHFNSGKVQNVQDIVSHWIDTLPCVNDEEAAPYAYAFLAQLIEQQNPVVTNQTAAPKLLTAIAQALEAETLQGQNAGRAVAAAKILVQSTGMDFNALMSTWNPQLQKGARAFFA